MRRPMHRLAGAVALAAAQLVATGAAATTLAEAFDAALAFDGTYRAAGHELASSRQARPLALATMLPSAVAQASTASVSGNRSFPNSGNQEVSLPVDYNSPQTTLQVRQPIFNAEGIVRLRQADAQIEAAEALFDVRALELVERTGMAYLQALLANEACKLARTELASLEAQHRRALRRESGGEGTRIEVAQTRASLEMARVRLQEALDQLANAQRGLRRVTGLDVKQLRTLEPDRRLMRPDPQDLDDWFELAERHNPTLRMRRLTVEIARHNVDRNRAGHLPRLDLVGSMSRSTSESISSINQTSSLRSIGVQLTLPLYSGGGIEASVKQALSERERADEELRADRETLRADLQRHFAAVAAGPDRQEAYRRVVESTEAALAGTSRALEVGMATQADVLDAETKRFASQRDLLQSRIDYLAARMKLLMLSGHGARQVVADLDRLLALPVPLETRTQP